MDSKKYSRKLKTGEVIFKEGDVTKQAYLIEEGEIELSVLSSDNKKKVLSILKSGSILGEMTIIEESKCSVTATVKKDCTLTILLKDQIRERIDNADPIIKLLLDTFIQRAQRASSSKSNRTISLLSGDSSSTKTVGLTKGSGANLTTVGLEQNVLDKLRFESELKKALEKKEFSLQLQPIVATKSGKTSGFEALCRWKNNLLGNVRTDVFMNIAEQTSLIIPIGHWILQNACEEFGKLNTLVKQETGRPTKLFISINISGRQISDDDKFFDVLQKAVWANKLLPSNIKLEVTERVFIKENSSRQWIKKCREIGYSVALDDFGTGYSSLSCLKDLEVNNIKIDKSFIKDINDRNSQVIVKSISQMCGGLNKPIIVEGVETKEQYEALQKLGCHYCQGFYFSKPLTIDTVIEQFKNKARKSAA